MSDPVDKLLRRFAVLYGPPDSPDDDEFLQEYRAGLKGASDVMLQAIGDLLRDEHLAKRWPTPGEVRVAWTKAAAKLSPPRRAPEHKPFEQRLLPPPEPHTWARIQEMLKDFMAQQVAASEAEAVQLPDVSRPAFEKMQRESPNAGLHRILSPVSRRMTGERDE